MLEDAKLTDIHSKIPALRLVVYMTPVVGVQLLDAFVCTPVGPLHAC